MLAGGRRVGEREGGDVVRVGDELVRDQGVQRRLDAGQRVTVAEHAGEHQAHHLFVGHRVALAKSGEAVDVEVSEAAGADRAQVRTAALDGERLHAAAEDVVLFDLDGGVAAAGLHERQVAADEVGEVDELRDVVASGVGVVPGERHLPVRRARLRIVGPPLPMRLVCIGWPLPQLGMAKRRKSLPTASTFMK